MSHESNKALTARHYCSALGSTLCAGHEQIGTENSRRRSVRLRAVVLLGMIAVISVGCTTVDTVPIPVSDATEPTITLDAFGIPLQRGASSQPDPETIDASCCPLARNLRSRQTEVSLVATGVDADGGVQNVRIVIGLTVTCSEGQVQQFSEQYENPDSTPRAIGAAVRTKRITNATFKASKYCAGLPQAVRAVVTAEVVNFSGGAQGAGQTVRTPGFTLLYP